MAKDVRPDLATRDSRGPTVGVAGAAFVGYSTPSSRMWWLRS
jgi:hypothetical protein